ncbi:MAG: N-acetyltransferase family protein [Acidimicrobiales bacterium]
MRDATHRDGAAITGLYNALIPATTVAWTEALQPIEETERWLTSQQQAGHPVLVATVDDQVVGYATYGPFRDWDRWPGYRLTVEHTIHVGERAWGTGVGRALMEALVVRAVGAGRHVMIAGIDAENMASIRFHERIGFVEVGRLPQTGTKFGRWLDLVFMQRILDPGDA